MTPYIWTIIIAAVLIYAIISGYVKGLLSQIGQIAGLIIGVLAARALTPQLLTMLSVDAGDKAASTLSVVLCYMFVFFAAYFVVVLVARLLKLVVKVACLGVLDRLSGALFKVLKWMLILSLVYNFCTAVGIATTPNADDYWIERATYRMAPAVLDMWQFKTSNA